MLYLVPTPVGNLEDMTPRAIRTLQEATLILAEDTRTTGRLLKHFEIETKMKPYHAHNEHQIIANCVERLEAGDTIALVSDAGTPAISDPGFLLVRACHEANIPVRCLPGATAIIPALASSGLPTDKFYFEGFLPPKKGRQTRLSFLATLPCTFVLYESPHRIIKTLRQLSEHIDTNRLVSVHKEISKLHETLYRGTIAEVLATLENLPSIKGEFVITVAKPL